MAFDFKKEYKELYGAKTKPTIVNVPTMNYLAVRGCGDPNDKDGEYQKALGVLYAVAYTLRMSYKTDYKIEGFFEYVVPPLEGLWWQDGIKGYDKNLKDKFSFISLIRLPDFITRDDFDWAVKQATTKKKIDCTSLEFYTLEEGLSAQITHIGSYDDEPKSVSVMNDFLKQNGYETDLSDKRHHHEIYLSDPRKTEEKKLKTIIRHPIKKI